MLNLRDSARSRHHGAWVTCALLVVALTVCSNALAMGGRSEAAGCAGRVQPYPVGPAPAAESELVPPGATAALICRYRGLNDPYPRYANSLAGAATVTDSSTLHSLTDQFNALPPTSPSGTAAACPADDGSSLVVIFDYASSAPDPVFVRPTGCSSATNGYLTANMAFEAGQRLRTELQHLTGCPSSLEDWFCDSDSLPAALATEQRAFLRAELIVSGKRGNLRAIVRRNGYRFSARSVTAGRLTIRWYARNLHGVPVSIASGEETFNDALTKPFTIHLTSRGRQLLGEAITVTLTARATFIPAALFPPPSVAFTPDSGPKVEVARTFTLAG